MSLVFDVGGTAIKYALFEDGKITYQNEIPTPQKKVEFTNTIINLIKEYNQKEVAFSMPGLIDDKNNIALTAGALHEMNGFDFNKELAGLDLIKIKVENDAKCASLAEVSFGSLKDINDAIVLVIGTGVGGCVVLDKKIRKGLNLASGEVSSIITNPNDLDNSWMWNTLGARGLVNSVNEVTGKTYANGREVFSDIEDEKVKEGIKKYTDYFAIQIFNMQSLMDVEAFAIGGGVSRQEALIESFKQSIDDLFSKTTGAPIKKPLILRCQYANDANLYGAYSLL